MKARHSFPGLIFDSDHASVIAKGRIRNKILTTLFLILHFAMQLNVEYKQRLVHKKTKK